MTLQLSPKEVVGVIGGIVMIIGVVIALFGFANRVTAGSNEQVEISSNTWMKIGMGIATAGLLTALFALF